MRSVPLMRCQAVQRARVTCGMLRISVAALLLTFALQPASYAQDGAEAEGFFAAGEFAAGNAAASRRTQDVTQARRDTLAGGSGADFTALIQLIQDQTNGLWEDIDGDGGSISQFESGIRVDPNGVLAARTRRDLSGNLAAIGVTARKAALNADMAKLANLRVVSLTRLEQAVADRLAAGKPVLESMKNLGGLTKIEYVVIDEQSGELLLAGPAEAWEYNEFGMAIGVESGRPTLHLDDLVTVLRTFSPEGTNIFGCSIDPQPENIAAVKEFAAQSAARGPLSPAGIRRWAGQIEDLLGLQDITVYGVPANSRVARVLVEADYRMKLIGVGELDGTSNIPDYFDLLRKNPELAKGGLDAMRWWMTMNYDEVLQSENGDVYQIRGSAVQCLSENQFLTETGQRVSTGQAEPVNRQFASNFTQHYQELAQQDPIFADLQGVFDLALVAALIERDQLDDQVGWNRGVFAVNGDYVPQAYAVPKQTESVVAYRVFNRQDVVLQAAGGVRGDLMSVVNNSEIRKTSPRIGGLVKDVTVTAPADRWWWDAR